MSSRRFPYFVAAARALHFGRAAEELGVAQPALSQQIKALEKSLSVRLFRRVRRGIELTEAGAALLPEAEATLAQEAHAISIAQRTARGELGIIRLGYVNTAMLGPELPVLLASFRKAVPKARVELAEMAIEALLASLHQDRLDVAFVRGPPGSLPTGLRARTFSRSELMAVMPAELARVLPRPIPLRDLHDCPFLTLRDPHGVGLGHHVQTLCAAAGFTPRIEMRVDNATSIVGLVAAGFGVGLVPAELARIAMRGVAFIELADAGAQTEVLMVDRPSDRSPLKLRLVDTAQQSLSLGKKEVRSARV